MLQAADRGLEVVAGLRGQYRRKGGAELVKKEGNPAGSRYVAALVVKAGEHEARSVQGERNRVGVEAEALLFEDAANIGVAPGLAGAAPLGGVEHQGAPEVEEDRS